MSASRHWLEPDPATARTAMIWYDFFAPTPMWRCSFSADVVEDGAIIGRESRSELLTTASPDQSVSPTKLIDAFDVAAGDHAESFDVIEFWHRDGPFLRYITDFDSWVIL